MNYQQLSILPIIEQQFFNTISLTGPELSKAKEQTGLQDQRVLEIFEKAKAKMTPFEVLTEYNKLYPEAVIWSIRRSITVLTRKKKKLVKLKEMKMEQFGKVNHYWELAK